MAEINTATTGDKPGVRRSKKHSTRVDLTPMVDLGFLLITFFIFTTTMSEPVATKLIMPDDTKVVDQTQVGKSSALTILPVSDNKVFYYHGAIEDALKDGTYGFTNFSVKDGIGQVIRDKQVAMDRMKPGFRKDLTLMIKPTEAATYEDIVNALDEVAINVVPHYALMEITADEKKIIVEKNGKL